MEGWTHDKFKNQIQYKSGYTWSKEQELQKQEPHSVRVLTVSNVQVKLDLEEELYLKDVSEKDKKEKAVSKNWCIAVSSNGNRKRIGNVVYIKDDTDYLFASFLTAFRPKDNSDIIPEYFFWWLSSYPIQERLSSVSEGTTGLGNLSIRFLRNLDIDFPQKQQQQAIVNILSKVDEAIASVQNSIAAATRLKKSLMQNLLTGKMKPDGTFRAPEEFYIDEKFGKVPVGWEVKRIDEISDNVQYGLNLASSEAGNIPMLRMNNIVNGEMTDTPLVYVSLDSQLLTQYELEQGDILFNRTNSMDLVGKVGVFKLPGKYVFASYLIRIKVSKENNPYYVNMALNSHSIQCSLRSKATPAVSQANINSKSLRQTNMFIPKEKKEQDSIVTRIDSIDQILLKEQDNIRMLERLKKSLMQNLLSGKVVINVK
jgi:type I restriction enzyme S subunit